MPARHRIAALSAVVALATPSAALAQAGAGDSQYQDPFGAPPTSSAPAGTGRPQAADNLGRATPAIVRDAPAAKTATGSGGVDVLPVAAAALVLVLGGVALWRRPHAPK